MPYIKDQRCIAWEERLLVRYPFPAWGTGAPAFQLFIMASPQMLEAIKANMIVNVSGILHHVPISVAECPPKVRSRFRSADSIQSDAVSQSL